MNSRCWQLLVIAGLLSMVVGCGDGLVKVQGEVLLDEKPLPNAVIALIPQDGGRTVTGKSDAGGKFQLTTSSPNDGVKPGSYKVTVTAREVKFDAKPDAEEGYVEKHIWLAPERYSNPATSELTTLVKAGEPHLVLRLVSATQP